MRGLGSRSIASVLTAGALAVAGCYSGAPAPGATVAPLVAGSPEASQDPVDCPNFVEIVETGSIVGGEEITEDGPLAREQRRLDEDAQAAVAYGAAHPDEFGSVRYENGPRVRIVIGFTARIEEHCAALRAILEYPDEFEMFRQEATEARLMEVQQEIIDMAGGSVIGIGTGPDRLDVQLRADGEAVAAEILEAYRGLVTIQVGMLPYPDPFAGGPVCRPLPGPILEGSVFAVTIRFAAATVRSGADFQATATVTNTGPVGTTLETGQPLTALVFGSGTDRLVGGFTGILAGTGFGGDLAPGEGLEIDVLGSTASCEPGLGYAIPPGQYDVRVLLDQYAMHDNAPTEVGAGPAHDRPVTGG
jgi:hypothetical protein